MIYLSLDLWVITCWYHFSGRLLWISRQSIAIKRWRHMGHVCPPTHQHGSKRAMSWRWRLHSAHHHSKATDLGNHSHPCHSNILTPLYNRILYWRLTPKFVLIALWSRRSDRTAPKSLWSLRPAWEKTRINLPPVHHKWLAFWDVQSQWTSVDWVSPCYTQLKITMHTIMNARD